MAPLVVCSKWRRHGDTKLFTTSEMRMFWFLFARAILKTRTPRRCTKGGGGEVATTDEEPSLVSYLALRVWVAMPTSVGDGPTSMKCLNLYCSKNKSCVLIQRTEDANWYDSNSTIVPKVFSYSSVSVARKMLTKPDAPLERQNRDFDPWNTYKYTVVQPQEERSGTSWHYGKRTLASHAKHLARNHPRNHTRMRLHHITTNEPQEHQDREEIRT